MSFVIEMYLQATLGSAPNLGDAERVPARLTELSQFVFSSRYHLKKYTRKHFTLKQKDIFNHKTT